MIQSDEAEISEDRREALRYALAIGSGAALASAIASPASAQAAADNTLDRVRAAKVMRIAVLPGELPYFNKDLASGTWSGMCIEMANDIAKLLDVKLEYTESTYGNSILDLQSNKIDVGFALNPTPQRALVVDFCGAVFHHPFGAMLRKGLEARTWADINKPEVRIAVDAGSANETVARRFAPNATIKSAPECGSLASAPQRSKSALARDCVAAPRQSGNPGTYNALHCIESTHEKAGGRHQSPAGRQAFPNRITADSSAVVRHLADIGARSIGAGAFDK